LTVTQSRAGVLMLKVYQESEISLQYVNNYQKAVTAIRRCRQNSPAFVEFTSVCIIARWWIYWWNT